MQTSELRKNISDVIYQYLNTSSQNDIISQMHLLGNGAVHELEEKLKRHYKMKYALCVSNGTTGLMGIALALNLTNKEFITTPYTYGASLSSWLLFNNKVLFADIEGNMLTIDPESVRKLITSKTCAILSVDIYGVPCDSESLRKIADKYGIWYIADACQSFGAYRNGNPASSLADAVVISFTTGKPLFSGEGGAILTNNMELYEKLLWYTQHPLRQRIELGLKLDNEFSINGRIHPLGAIWANSKFEESLLQTKLFRTRCFELIDEINKIGYTEKLDFRDKNIEPSFFKITASWRKYSMNVELQKELVRRGYKVTIDKAPVRLIFKQPSFLCQFDHLFKKNSTYCPEAEHQTKKRIWITIHN